MGAVLHLTSLAFDPNCRVCFWIMHSTRACCVQARAHGKRVEVIILWVTVEQKIEQKLKRQYIIELTPVAHYWYFRNATYVRPVQRVKIIVQSDACTRVWCQTKLRERKCLNHRLISLLPNILYNLMLHLSYPFYNSWYGIYVK